MATQTTNNNTAELVTLAAVGLLVYSGSEKKRVGEISPGAQTALAVGGLGLVAYFLLKYMNKTGSEGLPDAAKKQLKILAARGIVPSWTDPDFEAMAATLRTAFDDCGTDWDAVLGVMQRMQNDADIYSLIAVYGTRGYKGCFDGDYFGQHNWNLAEAMSSELSASEISEVNNQLASVGITYKF